MPAREPLQADLRAHIHAARGQGAGAVRQRDLDRGFRSEAPAPVFEAVRVAHAEHWIQQAATTGRLEGRVLAALQIEQHVVVIARRCRTAEPRRVDGFVKGLDGAVEKAATKTGAADDQIRAPVLGELVVDGHVELGKLEVDEIVLSRQIPDGLKLGGAQLATALEFVQILLDLGAGGPGVLIGHVGLHAPAAGFQ